MTQVAQVLAGYEAEAGTLTPRFDALDCEAIYAGVQGAFPHSPARVLGIGAATGRDAEWLTRKGYRVTAVEPVAAFRDHGARQTGSGVRWIDSSLPELAGVDGQYDMILISGVWQHLPLELRAKALRRIKGLLAAKARVVLSLRHGPGPEDRPVFPCAADAFVKLAQHTGLTTALRLERGSLQAQNRALGVRWTWLVLEIRGNNAFGADCHPANMSLV